MATNRAVWHQKHIRIKLNNGLLTNKWRNGHRVSSDDTATCKLLTFAFEGGGSRFRGLTHVQDRSASVPSSARVPGVAHPCPRLIHFLGPLSHYYEEKWKSAYQFKLSRKWRCGRSECTVNKKFQIITKVPHDHCACCCLRRKNVQWHRIVETVLGWREQDYQFLQTNQPEMSWLDIWHNTWPTVL